MSSNPTDISGNLSRFCITTRLLIEALQTKYPKRPMKLLTSMLGRKLQQFFSPFKAVEDLMITITFLVENGLAVECIAGLFKFSISEGLRVKSTVSDVEDFYNKHYKNSTSIPLSVYLQPWLQVTSFDKASTSLPSFLSKSCSPTLKSTPMPSSARASFIPRLRLSPSHQLKLQSFSSTAVPSYKPQLHSSSSATILSPLKLSRLLLLRGLSSHRLPSHRFTSPPPPKPQPPASPSSASPSSAPQSYASLSQPYYTPAPQSLSASSQLYYKPTHYTSTSVPSTNDSDNSKGFLERYQVFFENRNLVPSDYSKYPGLHDGYDEASGLNFVYSISMNHCNDNMLYRSRSRLMVVLPAGIQTLIGIFPLIEGSNEPITLDRLAFLTICYEKYNSFDISNQTREKKALEDIINATKESLVRQYEIFKGSVASPELLFIWVSNFFSQENTIVQHTINGIQSTCFNGRLVGMWIGQDGKIFLDIRGVCGPWLRWLSIFDYNRDWSLMHAS
ncbi:hypothetical protein QC760_010621 [Botrytis cinerea]